jgi:hypothetical protein
MSTKRLQAITDVLKIIEGMSPLQSLERILVVSGLLVALITVTYLVFARVTDTEIESRVSATGITFELATESPVLQPSVLPEIEVHDVREVAVLGTARTIDMRALDGGVARLRAIEVRRGSDVTRGEITLPGLKLDAGTRVSVSATGANTFDLTFMSPSNSSLVSDLDFTGKNAVELLLTGSSGPEKQLVNEGSVYPIRVAPESREFTMKLTLPAGGTIDLLPEIPIKGLSFLQSDSESARRDVSSIRSGSITRTELNGDKTEMHSFQALKVESATREKKLEGLRVRELKLGKDGLDVQFYGPVAVLETGHANAIRNLIPSKLEWINSNARLKLLWSAIVFGAGLIIGVVRWFASKA